MVRNLRYFRALRLSLAAGTLGAFGLGCLMWVGWSLADAALAEAHHGAQLAEVRQVLEEAPSSAASVSIAWPDLAEGDLVGRIEIDRLGISAIILAGTGARTLRRAVGHIPGTSLPGEDGTVGIAGHRDSFFRKLEGAAEGDVIRLLTPLGTMNYQVTRAFVVDPEDVHVLDSHADREILTLVSCYPFYYVGPAPQRFIVQAHRLEAPAGGRRLPDPREGSPLQ
jgi:sortase A